jgi:hypothetical protein
LERIEGVRTFAAATLIAATAATLAMALALVAAASAAPDRAHVEQCGTTAGGFVVYANGVTCPTAKKLAVRLASARLTAWQSRQVANGKKLLFPEFRGYRCIASYQSVKKRQLAGSCLRLGTTGTGFGWTRDGAQVPLPPGVDQSAAG